MNDSRRKICLTRRGWNETARVSRSEEQLCVHMLWFLPLSHKRLKPSVVTASAAPGSQASYHTAWGYPKETFQHLEIITEQWTNVCHLYPRTQPPDNEERDWQLRRTQREQQAEGVLGKTLGAFRRADRDVAETLSCCWGGGRVGVRLSEHTHFRQGGETGSSPA